MGRKAAILRCCQVMEKKRKKRAGIRVRISPRIRIGIKLRSQKPEIRVNPQTPLPGFGRSCESIVG
jgi:hypothetical protein